MIKTTFRIARGVTRTHGPYKVRVGAIDCTVTLNPAAGRVPPPVVGAPGADAVVEVQHVTGVTRQRPDKSFNDTAIIAEALEVAVTATNKVIHLIAFVGGFRKQLPLLSRIDLADFSCEDLYGAGPRAVPIGTAFTLERIVLREPGPADDAEVQRRLGSLPTLGDAESLWLDGLEAFYDGRLREAVVVLRAAVEVGWRAGFNAAVAAYRKCSFGPIPTGLLDTVADKGANKHTPVPDRLTTYSRIILGFSFRDDWEPDVTSPTKWNKLNTFFDQRHGVAHGTVTPSMANVWDALTLTREVLDKIRDLSNAVIAKCPP